MTPTSVYPDLISFLSSIPESSTARWALHLNVLSAFQNEYVKNGTLICLIPPNISFFPDFSIFVLCTPITQESSTLPSLTFYIQSFLKGCFLFQSCFYISLRPLLINLPSSVPYYLWPGQLQSSPNWYLFFQSLPSLSHPN